MSRRILSISVFFCLGSLSSSQSPTTTETPAARPASFFWGDFDRDGLADAFVIAPGGKARLLRNRSDGTLEDATEVAGLASASGARFALWEDFDRDQDLDLFVGTAAGARLFANEGSAAFLDVTEIAGLARSGPVLDAGFLDYDRDGLPDLHLRTSEESLLYRNLGNALFQRMDLGLEPNAFRAGPGTSAAPDEFAGSPADSAPRTPPRTSGSEEAHGKNTLARPREAPSELEAPLDVSLAGREALFQPPGSLDAIAFPACALAIKDQGGTGCLQASSVPALGMLYPLSSNLFVDPATGFLGVGMITPADRLDVNGRVHAKSTVNGPVVKGEWIDPTRGYLAVQASAAFDGITTANWPGFEIGTAGISTGAAATDNYGVMGHASGVGVRGEFSGDPTGTFAELGTLNGVGIRADGSTLAGEFLGDVDVRGGLDVENGLVEAFDGTGQKTFELNPGSASGSSLEMFNEANTSTFFVDSDTIGQARLEMRGDIRLNTSATNTIELDNDLFGNGDIRVLNGFGQQMVRLGAQSNSGWVTVADNGGALNIILDGGSTDGGAHVGLWSADSKQTLVLDAQATNDGGLIGVRNDFSATTVELIGDTGYGNSGAISLFDRTTGANSVILRGRDSAGSGGELQMTGTSGGLTVDIDGDNGGGGLLFREDDGSLMCDFYGTSYTFHDAAGTATISFNRTTGAKSAVVDTPTYGKRLLYCMESPEVWFEDFGSARLQGGVAVVRLDPMYLETVTIDEGNPLKVFVELNGPSNGVWIEKASDRFIVREQAGGTGDAAFDWRVVAKRKGLESLRLRAFDDELAAEAALGGDPPAVFQPMQPHDSGAGETQRAIGDREVPASGR